jgi:hypothetical protein
MKKVKVGDVFYSEYFDSWCQVVKILDDGHFLFKRNKKSSPLKSRIKTDYLLDNNLIFRNNYFKFDNKQNERNKSV